MWIYLRVLLLSDLLSIRPCELAKLRSKITYPSCLQEERSPASHTIVPLALRWLLSLDPTARNTNACPRNREPTFVICFVSGSSGPLAGNGCSRRVLRGCVPRIFVLRPIRQRSERDREL